MIAFRKLCVLLLATTAPGTGAIIIRHDVEDQLYRDLAAQAKYAAVGSLEWKEGSSRYLGTANYIGVGDAGKKWLVTAGHNLNSAWTSGVFSVGGRAYDIDIESRRWINPPETGLDDIGVARILDPDNTLSIAPARFWNGAVPISNGLEDRLIGTTVGFGTTGNGNTGPGVTDKVKRAMQNRIDGYEVTYNAGADVLHGYLVDFDRDDAANNTLDRNDFPAANYAEGQKSSRAWLGLEGITDEGDSGGGLFVDFGTTTAMLGITSASTRLGGGAIGRYGTMSKYTPFNNELVGKIRTWTGIGPVPEPATVVVLAFGFLGFRSRFVRRS